MNKHKEDCIALSNPGASSITIFAPGGNAFCDHCGAEFQPYYWRSQADGFFENSSNENPSETV